MAWRIGQSWGSKENPLLVTIVKEGVKLADADGRREDDRLVCCASMADAELIVRAVNNFEHRRRIARAYGREL